MTYSRKTVFGALLLLVIARQASAEVSIDALIKEAGVREGAVASRDFQGWHPPQKILVRSRGDLVATLQAKFPDVQMVAVSSLDEILREAADADAMVGFCDAEAVAAATSVALRLIGSPAVTFC